MLYITIFINLLFFFLDWIALWRFDENISFLLLFESGVNVLCLFIYYTCDGYKERIFFIKIEIRHLFELLSSGEYHKQSLFIRYELLLLHVKNDAFVAIIEFLNICFFGIFSEARIFIKELENKDENWSNFCNCW